MSNPFTMAKAIATDAEHAGKIVTGSINRLLDSVLIGDESIAVSPYTLCYNTGFTDKDGNEIFEGDYIRRHFLGVDELVFFDIRKGGFYTSHVVTISETEIGGEYNETRYCQYPNATVIRRLDENYASRSLIHGSMLDALAEPTVDETPTVEPVEVDADIEDITHVDPDAGDDISVDWAARVDEAPGEY